MDRTAGAIAATLATLQPDSGRRALDDWERDTIGDTLDAAQAWADGELDLNTAAHCGVLEYQGPNDPAPHPSPRYSRFIAITTTPRTDPRWPALDRLVRTIVARQMIVTIQGVYESHELHIHDHAREWLRTHKAQEAA